MTARSNMSFMQSLCSSVKSITAVHSCTFHRRFKSAPCTQHTMPTHHVNKSPIQTDTKQCSAIIHTHLTALFPGLPGSAGTRKAKPIWILLKQETVSGSGISWAICKSAPRSRQITTPAPHHSVFTGRMPFLPPNQQRQSTEGTFSNHHRFS